MATVIGKLTAAELAKLEGRPYEGDEPKDVPLGPLDYVDDAGFIVRRPVPRVVIMGVMVMVSEGTSAFYATDFSHKNDGEGPSLREAQAFRATRNACLRYVRARAAIVYDGMTAEECEDVVQRLVKKKVVTIHVLDVPQEAFDAR